jgi:8-oxo-dGTP pyrophosphatase MutT (NUDIX family)
VPGGTVEPGEPLEKAVLREAFEETGLSCLALNGYLGRRTFHLPGAVHLRHFYHLRFAGDSPARWLHWERDPSDRSEPKEFELYWVPFPDGVPRLIGRMGALLGKVRV